ncbi:MAG: UTP--glucose-1-phosphate uridylyltransferase [bacterium]
MPVQVKDSEKQRIIDRTVAAGQEHVLRFWQDLAPASRDKLLAQLSQIDFDLVAKHHKSFLQARQSRPHKARFEPAEFIPIPKSAAEREAANRAKLEGEEALRRGRVAAFLVAGGQGTRLGFDGPKGKFPISPIRKKSLFQLHAEKILALSRRHDTAIPWYIMTSKTNHEETVELFERQHYFGLRPAEVMFFRQEMVPALDPNGKLLLETKDHIFENPNGHGGSLSALKNSGALDDMKDRGIDLIFYFQVDNVLVKMCDPLFLGVHLQQRADMSAKIVVKTDPEEKVGVLGRIDGKWGVIEYSDLSEQEKTASAPDGSLRFKAGNMAIHVLSVAFVERENKGGLRLPWHVAHKKIPFLDANGRLVAPEGPNGYKFETFVFDALKDAKRAVFLEARREAEFSPVKNATGVDSPESARQDLMRMFARWLQRAGVHVPCEADGSPQPLIEISPLFALDAEEVERKVSAGLTVSDSLYLE